MSHVVFIVFGLPIVALVMIVAGIQQREAVREGAKRAHRIAEHQGWVSPHRLMTQAHMTKSSAQASLREAMNQGLIYQADDGRYYCRLRGHQGGSRQEAHLGGQGGRSAFSADLNRALVERAIGLLKATALENGEVGPGALAVINIGRKDAVRILGMAVDRGLLIKGQNGRYHPSANLRDEDARRKSSSARPGGSSGKDERTEQGRNSEGAPEGPIALEFRAALAILNVSESASRDAVERAWKENLRRNHPDLGGSTWIAQQINAAWETVKKHRGWT